MLPYLIRAVWTVEQECGARHGAIEYVETLEKVELMTCDKVGFRHEIGGMNGIRTEA